MSNNKNNLSPPLIIDSPMSMDDDKFANGEPNNEKNSSNSIPVEIVENIMQMFIEKITKFGRNIEEKNTFIVIN